MPVETRYHDPRQSLDQSAWQYLLTRIWDLEHQLMEETSPSDAGWLHRRLAVRVNKLIPGPRSVFVSTIQATP